MILTALLVLVYIGIGAYTITGLLSVYEKVILIKKLRKAEKESRLQLQRAKDIMAKF